MKISHRYLLLFILLSCWMACTQTNSKPSTQNKEIDPFEAALPHGTSLPEQQLSEADQAKLANAIGKSVEDITFKDLLGQFEDAYGRLNIFSFWKLDCKACKDVNLSLQKIQHELGSDNLNLTLINLDSKNDQSAVNAYIRANNLTSNVYRLGERRPRNWKKQLIRSWEGELPALFIKNKTDGTDFFYQQEMSYEELFTVIQSLSL